MAISAAASTLNTIRLRIPVTTFGSPRAASVARLSEWPPSSEIDLRADSRKACPEHLRRRQPRRARRAVREVVSLNRGGVEHIVDVDPDLAGRPAESQDFRHTQIHLVDAISIERTRLDQVHRHVGCPPGEIPAERLR